jgi:glyoxylase-like metal-dependent hydrolase (beta-lactamase superfamily II)
VYVIEDDDGLVLVDGGWALEESRARLIRVLKSLGYRLNDIRQFLVTHLHRDHYTQAVAVRREVGSGVSIGIGEKPALELIQHHDPLATFAPQLDLLRRGGALDLIRRIEAAGLIEGPATNFELPDRWIVDGVPIELAGRTLHAVATPGHTQGHLVFADLDAQVLFAGDHVLPHITPSIGFEPIQASFPLRDYLGSLRTVLDLPDLRLLPAHGPVADSAHRRTRELIAHHEQRLALCVAAVESGASTGAEVAQQLLWTRRERQLETLDMFNQMLAVCETHAHLQVLAMTGRLVTDGADPVRYRIPGVLNAPGT